MESGLNSDTVQVEILPDEISSVFVDSTGKRKKRFRTLGFVAGGIAAAYGAMLGLSFAGGPISPHALLPVPGVPTVAPINSGPQPGGSMTPVSEGRLSRTSGEKTGTLIGATSTPRPGVSGKGPTAVVPPPTPSGVTATGPGTPTPAPTKTTPAPSPSATSPAPSPSSNSPAADPPASSPVADPSTTTAALPAAGGGGSAPTATASATVTETASPTTTVTAQASNLES